MGILPEAMINFLARLGWGYKDQEVFTLKEIIELFDLKDVNKSHAVFDEKKLLWLNREHMKMMDIDKLIDHYIEWMEKIGYPAGIVQSKPLRIIVEGLRPRVYTLKEMAMRSTYFFDIDIDIPRDLRRKYLSKDNVVLLTGIYKVIKDIDEEHFDAYRLEKIITAWLEANSLKLKDVAQPLRVCLTGQTVSPGVFTLMEGMGKKLVLRRLEKVITYE